MEHQVRLHDVHAAAMVLELTPVDLHGNLQMHKVMSHLPYTIFGVGIRIIIGIHMNLKSQLFQRVKTPNGRWRPVIAPPNELISPTFGVSELVPEWKL